MKRLNLALAAAVVAAASAVPATSAWAQAQQYMPVLS